MKTAQPCPPDERLMPLCRNEPADETVRLHVDDCTQCQERVQLLGVELASLEKFCADPYSTIPFKTPEPNVVTFSVERASLPPRIGRYVVKKELGDGRSGQGRVYLALHPTLERDVVVKIARLGVHHAQNNELLIAEGKLLAQLDHPYLAKVYDLDFHEDCPYLVMEYVRGKNLAQYKRHSSTSPAQAAQLIAKVAQGVAAAHGRGVIHQDLKPENIVIDEHGDPKVIDFGMARLENAWESSLEITGGTAQYMAPEQAEEFLSGQSSGTADPRRDVFSLGAILYYLLTGAPPFTGPDVSTRLLAAKDCQFDRESLRRPEIPNRIAKTCLRAMSPTPEQRPASAAALGDELASFAKGRRSGPWKWIGVAAVVIVLILGCAAAAYLGIRGEEQPVPEEQVLVESLLQPQRDPNPRTPASLEDLVGAFDNSPLPLHDDDQLTFHCQVPRGSWTAAFMVTPAGDFKELSEIQKTLSRGEEQWVRYPSTGYFQCSPGTTLILFCAHPSTPPTKAMVARAFADITAESWPKPGLPSATILSIQRSKVRAVHWATPRGPDEPQFHQVRDLVDQIRDKLAENGDDFRCWGIVLPCEKAVADE